MAMITNNELGNTLRTLFIIRKVFLKTVEVENMINNSTEIKKAKPTSDILFAKQNTCNTRNNVVFDIKEEQLDISKQWMQTRDVNVYRETFIIKKTFTIEVEREELIIENKGINTQTTNHRDTNTDIIRIPLSEENVEFTKHKIVLEDVSIFRQKIEDIKNIETTLKKEKLNFKIHEI